MTDAPVRSLAYTSLLVPEYDPALAFFTQVLRWAVVEDTALPGGKRWIAQVRHFPVQFSRSRPSF